MNNKIDIKGIIADLDDLCKRLQDDYDDSIPFEQSEEDRLTVYNAIELLEKQIPKKPTPNIIKVERLKIGNARWGKGTTVYKCPCCNNFISKLYDYCFKCGQALDWSDTE